MMGNCALLSLANGSCCHHEMAHFLATPLLCRVGSPSSRALLSRRLRALAMEITRVQYTGDFSAQPLIFKTQFRARKEAGPAPKVERRSRVQVSFSIKEGHAPAPRLNRYGR